MKGRVSQSKYPNSEREQVEAPPDQVGRTWPRSCPVEITVSRAGISAVKMLGYREHIPVLVKAGAARFR